MPPTPILVPEDVAAYRTGRSGPTIRKWAMEGRITRYGHGRGGRRYDVNELPPAFRDEYTGQVIELSPPPPLPTT